MSKKMDSFRGTSSLRSSPGYFFTFFGSQSFFFFAETKPHSLQRNSPGFALRIGLSFWQPTAVARSVGRLVLHATVSNGGPRGNRSATVLGDFFPAQATDRIRPGKKGPARPVPSQLAHCPATV
jgi:hypothetical protein